LKGLATAPFGCIVLSRGASFTTYIPVMEIITYGYDLPANHERGIARSDWSMRAMEDPRGFGWQVIFDHLGHRSRHMSKAEALAVLCKAS